jgi:hypothetical protein
MGSEINFALRAELGSLNEATEMVCGKRRLRDMQSVLL